MNFKSLMLGVAAVAVAFTSCSKSEENGTTTTAAGVQTTAKIIVTQTNNGTRAHNGSMTPTDEEKTINSVTMYVFGSTKVLEDIVTLDIASDNLSAEKVCELTTGNHYFYAVVNVPADKLAGITKSVTTTGEFEKTIFELTSLEEAADVTGSNFWMTNLSIPTPENLVVATKEQAEGGVNNITINVGRAVAKVGMDFIPNQQFAGELSNVTYRVRQNPDQMYSVPFFNAAGLVQTPYFEDATVGGYLDSSSDFKTAGDATTPCTDITYAIENSNEIPRQGNASYVSIKGKFTPEKVFAADGTTDGILATDGTFWRIASYDGDPATATFIGFESKYYSEAPAPDQFNAATQAVLKYEEGICYYALWIADNSKTKPNQKYVVKRNNYYWINVVSVNGAGWNDEDGVITDPTEELDKETWLKATIDIVDWSPIEQNGGI